MADSNSTGLGLPVLSTFTKEDFLKSAAAVQDHLRQQNPGLSESELDLKLSSGWWKPAVDFSAVLGSVNEKLAVACQEFAAADYSRKALDKFSTEARALLAGHEKALQLIEATILKNPSVWDQMHEHAMTKNRDGRGKEEGSTLLGMCARSV